MGKYYLSYDMVKHFTECSSVKGLYKATAPNFIMNMIKGSQRNRL